MLYTCYCYHVVRWELLPDWTLFCLKGFLSKLMTTSTKSGSFTGHALSPIYLHKVDLHSFQYIINLWQLRQRVETLAQCLEHRSCTGTTCDRLPVKTPKYFQLCFILLWLSCRKMGAHVRDWTFIQRPEITYIWQLRYEVMCICHSCCIFYIFSCRFVPAISDIFSNRGTK